MYISTVEMYYSYLAAPLREIYISPVEIYIFPLEIYISLSKWRLPDTKWRPPDISGGRQLQNETYIYISCFGTNGLP